MNDQDVYLLLSEQFRLIDDDLDDMVRRANYAQTLEIVNAWKQANLNYLKGRNLIFSKHEQQIKSLVGDVSKANESIKDALEDLRSGVTAIEKVTGVLSAGVNVGTKLIEKTEGLEPPK